MVGLAQCRITPLRGSAGTGAGAGPQQMPSSLDYEEALALLRAALALPAGANDRTATRVLAAVLTMTQRGEEALPLARRAAELAPGDAGAASLHAHLLLRGVSQEAGGREGVAKALKACEAAVAALAARGCATPAALLNNVGVLRCRLAAFAASAAERASELALGGAAFEKALTQVRKRKREGEAAAEEGCAGAGTARFTRVYLTERPPSPPFFPLASPTRPVPPSPRRWRRRRFRAPTTPSSRIPRRASARCSGRRPLRALALAPAAPWRPVRQPPPPPRASPARRWPSTSLDCWSSRAARTRRRRH
jgi:hypothetical protein